jgi:hypothetical protein
MEAINGRDKMEACECIHVENMVSSNGNKIANQFIIKNYVNYASGNSIDVFQSYDTVIAKRDCFRSGVKAFKKIK